MTSRAPLRPAPRPRAAAAAARARAPAASASPSPRPHTHTHTHTCAPHIASILLLFRCVFFPRATLLPRPCPTSSTTPFLQQHLAPGQTAAAAAVATRARPHSRHTHAPALTHCAPPSMAPSLLICQQVRASRAPARVLTAALASALAQRRLAAGPGARCCDAAALHSLSHTPHATPHATHSHTRATYTRSLHPGA